jgi:hypothetical protein
VNENCCWIDREGALYWISKAKEVGVRSRGELDVMPKMKAKYEEKATVER